MRTSSRKYEAKITNSKTFKLAQHFIKTHVYSREGLKELGILRSDVSLSAGYAEWIVAELLGLRLAESTVQKGYDAVNRKGQTYQIKSRTVKNLKQNTSFDITDIHNRFDYLIGVFFSKTLDLLGIIRVPYDAVVEMCRRNKNRNSFRWNKSVWSDSRIERLYWID
jgi:hypothetical protein